MPVPSQRSWFIANSQIWVQNKLPARGAVSKGPFPKGVVFISHQNRWKIAPFHHQTLLDLQNLPLSNCHCCCKNKAFLCFTQICLLKYLFWWHELSDCIYFNFVCSEKKKSGWGEKAERFLLFEIIWDSLTPFRVPHSSCVWFSFVSSPYQHPLRKIFSRELFFLGNLGIFLYLNYNSRHLWTIYMRSLIAVNAPFLFSCLPAPSGLGSVTSRLVFKMYRAKGRWWQTTGFVFRDINNGWVQHYCLGLLCHCR